MVVLGALEVAVHLLCLVVLVVVLVPVLLHVLSADVLSEEVPVQVLAIQLPQLVEVRHWGEAADALWGRRSCPWACGNPPQVRCEVRIPAALLFSSTWPIFHSLTLAAPDGA